MKTVSKFFFLLFFISASFLSSGQLILSTDGEGNQQACGSVVSYFVKVDEGFIDIASLQFGLCWDDTKLNYLSHDLLMLPNNDPPSVNTAAGEFAYVWVDFSFTGVNISNSTNLLKINFVVQEEGTHSISVCDNGILVGGLGAGDSDDNPVILTPGPSVGQTVTIPDLILTFDEAAFSGTCGDTITINVRPTACFTNIGSLQFYISWDETILEHVSFSFPMIYPLGEDPFEDASMLGKFGYFFGTALPDGLTLSDDTDIMQLKLRFIDSGPSTISFVSTPAPIEAFRSNGSIPSEVTVNSSYTATAEVSNYKTVMSGQYSIGSTWSGGCLPPNPIPLGITVDVDHDLSNNGIITNNGIIDATGFILTNNVGATYQGTGTFIGDFINNGTFKPGNQ